MAKPERAMVIALVLGLGIGSELGFRVRIRVRMRAMCSLWRSKECIQTKTKAKTKR
jgi:hypothetical protein